MGEDYLKNKAPFGIQILDYKIKITKFVEQLGLLFIRTHLLYDKRVYVSSSHYLIHSSYLFAESLELKTEIIGATGTGAD